LLALSSDLTDSRTAYRTLFRGTSDPPQVLSTLSVVFWQSQHLIDQLFNSTEKRLARTLLLLARYGEEGQSDKILQKVSQETLAEMIGTTRSRVNMFMTKFRKLGLIEYNGSIKINKSLLTVVLHE
jgi:CRP-like cAMP-binding protein